jgi:16S rRNA (uracil1498-N3)-methyltransferase
VLHMGRSDVTVRVGRHEAVDRELHLQVTLAVGMPANERMDTLVEKATELGVAVVQPLLCERAVLVLAGERAERKRAHWQAVAQAACEQCGRARVPLIEPVRSLRDWLASAGLRDASCRVLSLRGDATPWAAAPLPAVAPGRALILLSGPEGGLTAAEEDAARAAGFAPVSLGPRVLRAETAPLVGLAHLGLSAESARHNGT